MRNLAARIERLEEVYSSAEIIVIMITHFGKGEIKGWEGDGFYIARNPDETEEECTHRAYQEARAYGEAHPSLLLASGVLIIHMDREHVPYLKPEAVPVAESVVAQPMVKPKQPLSSPPSKPQPPRIMTIEEVEGERADRRHWMG